MSNLGADNYTSLKRATDHRMGTTLDEKYIHLPIVIAANESKSHFIKSYQEMM